MKFHSFLKIAVLFCALPLFAQVIQFEPMPPGSQPPNKQQRSDDAILTERARRYEERGEYEGALAIWKELDTKYPWNTQAVVGIPRCFTVLKKFDDAENYLLDLIEKSRFRQSTGVNDPTSEFSLSLNLGSIKRARGDTNAAWKIWNGAMDRYGGEPEAVRGLVSQLQRERLWEDCERIIRDYRKNQKDPDFMALELSNSLQAQMNYAAATAELLLYAESSPSAWQVAQSYLNRYPDDSTVVQRVTEEMNKALRRDKKNGTLWRMYAGYTLKAGMLDESLEATIIADSLNGTGGMLVLQCAQSMLVEQAVELARRGFAQVLQWQPAPEFAEKAEIGLGQCYEALGQWTEAKATYDRFVASHGNSGQIEDARFRAADIVLNYEQKPLEALTLFKGIWVRGRGAMKIQAGLRVGDCHARLKEFGPAISSWTEVVTMSKGNQTEEGTQALMRIARANVWRDSLELAQAALDSIQNGSTLFNSFNDAILYTALLEDGGYHGAMKNFAAADYALFCNDDATASEKFKASADELKYGRLAEWSRMEQALSLRDLHKPNDAIAVFEQFIADYPQSIDLPRAKYMQIIIRMEDLHDDAGALQEFQKYLVDYPRSMYLEQARRKARILQNRLS